MQIIFQVEAVSEVLKTFLFKSFSVSAAERFNSYLYEMHYYQLWGESFLMEKVDESGN